MSSESDQDLNNKIVKQLEYYFGDYNLPRDKFLCEKTKEDEGWVAVEVLLTFKRLSTLSADPEVITAAVEKAENGLLEVSEDKKKIRRNPDLPIPELNDARKKELETRTAYAKGFPVDQELNDIMTFLEPYGPIESCHRRTIPSNKKFKGSCFVVFKDIETCKKFVEAESIKFKDTELIRKFQATYFTEKKKEYEERIKAKKDKKQASFKEKVDKVGLPKGAIIHFSGIPEGTSLTREEIKEKIAELENVVVSFVDFSKGDLEGYLRLKDENGAVEMMKKVTDGELEVAEVKLKLRALEGDEEEEYLKKTAEAVAKMREKSRSSKFGKKRKGHYQNNSRDSKQRKTD